MFLAAAAEMSRDQILELVKQTVLRALADKPAAVYLFGSFARGEEKPTSDIDVAIGMNRPSRRKLHWICARRLMPLAFREVEMVEITEGDAL